MVFQTKFKRFLLSFGIIMFICLTTLFFTACSTSKLDAPDTFSVEGSILSWNSVDNAGDYIVRINDEDNETSNESFDLSIMPSGINKVQVRAKKHGMHQQSDFGETLYIKKLKAPSSNSMYGDCLYWGSVIEAKSYEFNLYNSQNNLIFSTITTQTQLKFSNIESFIKENEYCSMGVRAIGDGQYNVLEDNTIIFATIPSSFNTGYVINYSNEMETPYNIILDESKQSISWNSVYYSAKYNIEIQNENKDVVYRKENYDNTSLSIVDNEIFNSLSSSGKYSIRVQAQKLDSPIWIIKDNIARFTENNSQYGEYEFNVNVNAQLPEVTNLKFLWNGISWNEVFGASSYNIKLLDLENNELYSGNSQYRGENLLSHLNKITKNISIADKHKFIVNAIPNNTKLFIYKNQIVKFNQNSPDCIYEFDVTINDKIEPPTYFYLDCRYVDGYFRWYNVNHSAISKSVNGYYIVIEDDSGNIVYEKYDTSYFDGNFFELVDSNLTNYFKNSGNYKLKVQSVCNNSIDNYNDRLIITEMSETAEFSFNYNAETKEITSNK